MKLTARLTLALALAYGFAAAPGAAQRVSDVAAARAAGVTGERYDGYMGFAATPSEALRKQVGAINIRRRSLYISLAARRRVTPQIAGMAVACELLERLAVGEAYMLSDGVWRRRAAGEAAPRPAHCRTG